MTTKPNFEHLDRMQRRVMCPDSQITLEQWTSEPAEEQEEYYNWMLIQCGELADLL